MDNSSVSKLILLMALTLCALPTVLSQLHNSTECFSSPTGELEFTARIRGVPGPEGPKGKQGEKGSRGLRGPRGDTSLQGMKGDRGDSGLMGLQGQKGMEGSKGQKGGRGPQGQQGPPGRPGLQGVVGERGLRGPEGTEGQRGPQGVPGLPGPQGLQGPQGDHILSEDEFDRVLQALQKNFSAKLSRFFASLIDMQGTFTKCGIYNTCWTRVAHIDMTNPAAQCPSGLREVSNSTINQRACGKNVSSGCSSITFPIEEKYSHVCGRVRGYQYYTPDAFYPSSGKTINDAYIDGISVTHGSPRRHLWSYAANYHEHYRGEFNSICPCARPDPDNSRWYIPDFVGNDYYCESGFVSIAESRIAWEDPLWDGAGCVTPGNTCCQRHGWFHKQVNQTSDSIEVRWCADSQRSDEDIFTELVEIWVLN